MNTGTFCVSEDVLETYALGRLSELDCAPLEEHLLLCVPCQNRLQQIDQYIGVTKAATAQLDSEDAAA